MGKEIALQIGKNKTSPPARGRRQSCPEETILMRFIPSCEGQTLCLACFIVCQSDSSPPASGRRLQHCCIMHKYRFIPSCEWQTLSVYAAFSRLKHIVVQFAQMPFSTRHTSFSLHISAAAHTRFFCQAYIGVIRVHAPFHLL